MIKTMLKILLRTDWNAVHHGLSASFSFRLIER